MNDYILITGASSGIGLEMAKQLAARKHNLVLTARSLGKLTALQSQLESAHGVQVVTVAHDLSEPGSAEALYEEIKSRQLSIAMLVNNAGSGLYGNFSDTDLNAELRMIALNVTSLVTLTKLFLQDMLVQKRGRILNVASLLSYLPFPYYTVYSATKSFVLAFSETLAAELEGSGVSVVTLCPGPVDTAFNSDAMWKTNAYKSNRPVSPVGVAEAGVNLLLHGRGTRVVGFNNWFISKLPRITPSRIMMRIKKSLASQQNR
jgi:short-subunit dehydrogenase